MKTYQWSLLWLFLITLAPQASAQIYKCKDAKGKLIYADAPCGTGGNQTLTDIQNMTAAPAPAVSPHSRQLDAAVRRAIATGDMQHAESLALTNQHWQWIAEARQEMRAPPVLGRTEADLSAEKSGSLACQRAQRDYEVTASAYKQTPGTIDAARSVMYAACGIKEPTQINVRNRTHIHRNYYYPR